jgi:hypothetical protein
MKTAYCVDDTLKIDAYKVDTTMLRLFGSRIGTDVPAWSCGMIGE